MVKCRKRVAIVTGASRGIGRSVSQWLAANGTAVMMTARSLEPLQQAAESISSAASSATEAPVAIQCGDVADAGFCRHVINATLNQWGRIDALVNNAGVFEPVATVADADPVQWQTAVAVNLFGPFLMARSAIPSLRKQHGRIVNVSSGAAQSVIQAASAYCASKAALNHFTRVLAAEEPDIVAVAVRPGVVDTRMQALIRRDGPRVMPAEQAGYYEALYKEGRLEPPTVPARAIAWLALHAPGEFSGGFYDYDDNRIMRPAIRMMTSPPEMPSPISPAD